MKQLIIFLSVILAITNASFAQKNDRENLRFQQTHIPSKLIYDQVKNYGVNVSLNSTNQYTIDYEQANNYVVKFKSYDKVDFNNADMKIYVNYGPYTYLEEKTSTETKEEKVDSVKKKVTYYKRTLSFRYPITYKIVNSKNNVVLYRSDYSSDNTRYVETAQYRSEGEAAKAMYDNKFNYISSNINQLCIEFMKPCTERIIDMFDFYASDEVLDIFRIKKWSKDDEYNAHVKNVMNTFKYQTADEQTSITKEKIKGDIEYFQSFDGVFDPLDKKEDILYFSNYYNLATIFYCLDDYEKAQFYIQKLDSSEKQEKVRNYLKYVINMGEARNKKHLLNGSHLTYNPVTDFRLTGKVYTSDAASAAENVASAISSGTVVSTDKVLMAENRKEVIGKIVFSKETNRLQMVSNDNPTTPVTLTAQNCLNFNIDSVRYISCKHITNGTIEKGVFRVLYGSNKVSFVQLMDSYFNLDPSSFGFIRPGEDMVTYFTGFTVKKKMAAYFEDCPVVSEKAKDGDFGGGFSKDKISKYIDLAKQYDECK